MRHLGGYTAYFTVPDPGNLENWFLMHNEPGGLVAGIRPERGGTAKAMLSFTAPPLDYDRRDVPTQQRDPAAEVHRDGLAGAAPARRAARRARLLLRRASARCTSTGGTAGRAVLLGDAGYCGSPLAGLGTSMALVGAYVLAGELAATPDDHEAAFGRYQREMGDVRRSSARTAARRRQGVRAGQRADDPAAQPVDADDDAVADAVAARQAVPEGRCHHAQGLRLTRRTATTVIY